jgi:hypothetical protein
VIDGDWLAETKARIQAGDPTVMSPYSSLLSRANTALTLGPWSVTDDPENVPPSGDIHDFLQYGPYVWPDPENPGQFIILDGVTNPANELDAGLHWDMSQNANWLALAYFFTEDETFAERAALLLRTWYLDPATFMRPRLPYQVNPGISWEMPAPGSAERFALDIDAIKIIENSTHWTAADSAGMDAWANDYLVWLSSSLPAQIQYDSNNNHGVWFDVHPTLFLIFAGHMNGARTYLENVGPHRIDVQIQPDGTMPAELVRSDSLHYHEYVTRALMFLAEMSRHVEGVDLWTYESVDGGSIQRVLEFLEPYSTAQQAWPYFPGNPHPLQTYAHMAMYRRAALGYWDPAYEAIAQAVPDSQTPWMFNNVYAAPPDRAADVDDDWVVGFADMTALLSRWGACPDACATPCPEDIVPNCIVGFEDLTEVLTQWD